MAFSVRYLDIATEMKLTQPYLRLTDLMNTSESTRKNQEEGKQEPQRLGGRTRCEHVCRGNEERERQSLASAQKPCRLGRIRNHCELVTRHSVAMAESLSLEQWKHRGREWQGTEKDLLKKF